MFVKDQLKIVRLSQADPRRQSCRLTIGPLVSHELQILVRSLFFEFLGLAQITTSNLGTNSSWEFPGLNEMGVFPYKQNFKGHKHGRKVRLSANMYSFSNIYPPPKSISLAWIKSLTF